MAVLVEGISVILHGDSLVSRFPGGWEGFKKHVPNKSLCADNEIVRVGFTDPNDVEVYINELTDLGLIFLQDGAAKDMAVVDQLSGFTAPCSWLEFGHTFKENNPECKIAACRLVGSKISRVVTPVGWEYENSLSRKHKFVPTSEMNSTLKFLRRENELDVFLNVETGEVFYVGRTNR